MPAVFEAHVRGDKLCSTCRNPGLGLVLALCLLQLLLGWEVGVGCWPCLCVIVPGTRQTASFLCALGGECEEGRACASEDPTPTGTKMAQVGRSVHGCGRWVRVESRPGRCGLSRSHMFYMHVWNSQRSAF